VSGGAICNGGVAFEARRIRFCPTEGKRRRFYSRFQHWYGWESYCLGCGDRWQDGEMGERPFARAWRKEAIARHKAWWDRVTVSRRDRKRAWRAFMDEFFAAEREFDRAIGRSA
jgi:hypothetical protein